MFDIISLGAATVDILIKSDQLALSPKTISLPRSSKNEITQHAFCSGGGATNSAVSFSRLGLSSACVALIGTDPLSNYVKDDLLQNHVKSHLIPGSDPTDFSVILVASDGSRTILTNRGNSRLEESNLNWDVLSQTKWFYITSLEGNVDLLEKLIGFAAENSIKVALNPGSRELKLKKRLSPLMKHLDFLLLNRTESEFFSDIDGPVEDIWKYLSKCGCRQVAVTNGRHGAHLFFDGKNIYSPIINTKPVDETGAGDSFGSAYIAGLIHGLTPNDSLFWAVKNSASVVSALGAKAGLLTYDQIIK